MVSSLQKGRPGDEGKLLGDFLSRLFGLSWLASWLLRALTPRLKISQRPFIISSLGTELSKYESLEPQGKDTWSVALTLQVAVVLP